MRDREEDRWEENTGKWEHLYRYIATNKTGVRKGEKRGKGNGEEAGGKLGK